MKISDEAVEAGAKALDENFNPDRYPIMAAMFTDYARTVLEAAVPYLTPEVDGCDHAGSAWDTGGMFLGSPVYRCRPCGRLFVIDEDGVRIPYRRTSVGDAKEDGKL